MALGQIDAALEDNRLPAAKRTELEQFRSEVAIEEARLGALLIAVAEQTATSSDYSLLARIHARRGEWTRAAELERQGERTVPGLLGFYLLQAGDFATAEQFYRDYPDTSGDPDLLVNHGIALAALGRDQDAASLYREALELNKGHALAWLYLGNAYVRLDRNEAAIEAFRRFLQTGTEQHTSERVRRILGQLSNGDGA
jgi:tetratricopeptide (TPR) repeat protein